MMRCVFDTNAIISAMFSKNATPGVARARAYDTGEILVSVPLMSGSLRSRRLDSHTRCRPSRAGPLPWHQNRNAHRLPGTHGPCVVCPQAAHFGRHWSPWRFATRLAMGADAGKGENSSCYPSRLRYWPMKPRSKTVTPSPGSTVKVANELRSVWPSPPSK